MHFPKRLYGIENEFAVVGQMPDGTLVSIMDRKIADLIKVKPIENSVLGKEPIQCADRVWHTNGSCTYVDIGDHPEHATPECLSVRDVVKYNKAGEILINRMFDSPSFGDAHIRFLLFKNNRGYDIHADDTITSGQFGCHENYLLQTEPFHIAAYNYHQKMDLFKPLIPFLATRQIFDGSGWWEKDMTFHLSQRAFAIQNQKGTTASSNRPFFQIKTGDIGSDIRLHVISGDANICEFALYLKVGTMSLVLALLESHCCPVLNYHNAVAALKEISRYGDSCMHSFRTESGVRLSPLDVQSIFFESVRAQLASATYASDEIEAEVAHIMLSWEQALNAIYNHDHEWMKGKIDHVTKQYIAETHIRKQKIRDPSELSLIYKTIDIIYHSISNQSLQKRIKEKWHDGRLLNDNEIHDATLYAPQNTRARMRGMFVQALFDNRRYITDSLNWNQLNIEQREKRHSLHLPHGLIAHSDEFEKFLLFVK